MSLYLSSTTPAAPSGGTNILWQRNVSGEVSAYVPATPELTGTAIDLTGQVANIATTDLVAIPEQRVYRVSVYLVQTVAGSTSGTVPAVTITWNDFDTGVVKTATVTATNTANVVGTYAQGILVLNSTVATTISYATTGYASVGGTAAAYALHIRAEAL